MIDESDSNGLSVHLPFDIDSGQHENHLRFLELELSAAVHRKDVDGTRIVTRVGSVDWLNL